jgi:epoxide hydrolase-like predicted phosphatase
LTLGECFSVPVMGIRAVVFDIGGVLEITPPLGTDEKFARELGWEPAAFDAALRDTWRAGSIGTIGLVEVHARIGAILGIDAARVDAFMERVWVEYLGTLNVELASYFGSLRERGYRTAILSNSFVGAREREEAAYGFGGLCDFIVYSHEVGIQKPDPRIYALTCERLGLAPEAVAFLDDSAPIIEAASEFGMKAVRFVDNARAIGDIEALLGDYS